MLKPAYFHIVFVKGAFAHDQQMCLGVCRSQSLLTEGQETAGSRNVDQSRHTVRDSTRLLLEDCGSCWEISRPHSLTLLKNKLFKSVTFFIYQYKLKCNICNSGPYECFPATI